MCGYADVGAAGFHRTAMPHHTKHSADAGIGYRFAA
jgi:hypothetical protein